MFAIPTYGFIAMVFLMLGWALLRAFTGHAPVAESAGYQITAQHKATGLLLVAIVLRAFSQGCTALTGVEAVSNGVPNFKPPKSRNAANTLSVMGANVSCRTISLDGRKNLDVQGMIADATIAEAIRSTVRELHQ